MRGYPRGTKFLFQLTDTHMQSHQCLTPKQIRPGRADVDEIGTAVRWEMPPLKPRFWLLHSTVQPTSAEQILVSYPPDWLDQMHFVYGSPTNTILES